MRFIAEVFNLVFTPTNFWGAFYYATLSGLVLGAVVSLLK